MRALTGVIKKLLKHEFNFVKTTRKTLNNAFSKILDETATEGGSIEGKEEEEIYQVDYLGYHLDSNLSAATFWQ